MRHIKDALRRMFITICMLTRTTELAARWLGAGFFLPTLFVQRYASMGGLDPHLFAAQLKGVRSFKDDAWCGYWNALAGAQLASIEIVPNDSTVPVEAADTAGVNWRALGDALAPFGKRVAALMTMNETTATAVLSTEQQASPDSLRAMKALRSLIKAITYYQVSAFPGGTAARMEAYARSRALFNELIAIVGPLVGLVVEKRLIEVDGDAVEGYLVTPAGTERHPLAIITNGLEGTAQELAMPLLRYHDSGMAVFIMEMPGTYAYRQPMSLASEVIYHAVIDNLSGHHRIDPLRMGFVGVSFGAYWAARMAARSKKLRCVVACGAPTHHSFKVKSTIGVPDIIIKALLNTTGARNLIDLGLQLKALSLKHLYPEIKMPLLVINGDHDTLLSTQDSVDLAKGAQQGTLKLYADDDHCAMGHYNEWLDLSQQWLRQHLAPDTGRP
ncbi:MAG TPA: alpha/beta hydrolase [Aquabacterium sp.]|uniref:alpha/beta hydrolase family protein n=1 Tax=Aquabacterium sp. TaxID=1872578 RepID=UPI002E305996|nr:alpha/beta hydrolase [Aquabacterium sp.]HEX5357376.1 alpha/beta hydrolase [Aquabacterium sp.]